MRTELAFFRSHGVVACERVLLSTPVQGFNPQVAWYKSPTFVRSGLVLMPVCFKRVAM